jgi:hypothetical protein
MTGDEAGRDEQDRLHTRWSILRAMSAVGPDDTKQRDDPAGCRQTIRCSNWARTTAARRGSPILDGIMVICATALQSVNTKPRSLWNRGPRRSVLGARVSPEGSVLSLGCVNGTPPRSLNMHPPS